MSLEHDKWVVRKMVKIYCRYHLHTTTIAPRNTNISWIMPANDLRTVALVRRNGRVSAVGPLLCTEGTGGDKKDNALVGTADVVIFA